MADSEMLNFPRSVREELQRLDARHQRGRRASIVSILAMCYIALGARLLKPAKFLDDKTKVFIRKYILKDANLAKRIIQLDLFKRDPRLLGMTSNQKANACRSFLAGNPHVLKELKREFLMTQGLVEEFERILGVCYDDELNYRERVGLILINRIFDHCATTVQRRNASYNELDTASTCPTSDSDDSYSSAPHNELEVSSMCLTSYSDDFGSIASGNGEDAQPEEPEYDMKDFHSIDNDDSLASSGLDFFENNWALDEEYLEYFLTGSQLQDYLERKKENNRQPLENLGNLN